MQDPHAAGYESLSVSWAVEGSSVCCAVGTDHVSPLEDTVSRASNQINQFNFTYVLEASISTPDERFWGTEQDDIKGHISADLGLV